MMISFLLKTFIDIDHSFVTIVLSDVIKVVVEYVTFSNFRPYDISLIAKRVERTTKFKTREIFVDFINYFINSIDLNFSSVAWSNEWVVDKKQLRTNVCNFDTVTADIVRVLSINSLIIEIALILSFNSLFTENISLRSRFNIDLEIIFNKWLEISLSVSSTLTNHFASWQERMNKSTSQTFIDEEFSWNLIKSFKDLDEMFTQEQQDYQEREEQQDWLNRDEQRQQNVSQSIAWNSEYNACIIVEDIAQFMRNHSAQQKLLSSSDNRDSSEFDDSSDNENVNDRWNSSDLEYFDSMYNDRFVSTESALKHMSKNTYFKNIHLFLERAKEMMILKTDELIWINLWLSLQEDVLKWWYTLDDIEKRIMKYENDDSLDEWAQLLIKQFSQSSNVTIDSMLNEKYTLQDTFNRRESRSFAQKIIQAVKDVKLDNVKNQLDIMYNVIDLKLQRDIKRSNDQITLNLFMSNIDDCKHEWWVIAFRLLRNNSHYKREDNRSSQLDQNDQYNEDFSSSRQNQEIRPIFQLFFYSNRFQNSTYSIYQHQYSSERNDYDQSQEQNQYSNVKLSQLQSRLQIIATFANEFNSQNEQNLKQHQSFRLNSNQTTQNREYDQNVDHNLSSYYEFQEHNFQEEYQQRSQRVYQISVVDKNTSDDNINLKKKFYHSENMHSENDVYDNFYDEFYESEKAYDDQNVNFVTTIKRNILEYICATCKDSFTSKTKLFKHLRKTHWSN